MAAHILVAGGGIGGLASALALSRHGHRIDVLEQAAAFGEIGAGVQLGPNITRRLQALGLGEALAAVAAQPDALVVRSAASHAELARLPLGKAMQQRYGAPYLCVHRADLHGLLCDAVRAHSAVVTLNTDARLVEAASSDALVCASSADARAWEGDALVGADGLWSAVRKQVEPNDVPPRRTGHTAWRALVAQSALPVALRNGQRVDVWLGPRLHAVAYPVRGGEALNVVVVAESATPAGDARDWDQASSLAALQQATGRTGAALQALLEAMPAWRAWTLADRTPLSSADTMARGRVALVGDAAHPMLPYLAQGAGMAIEDAVALADALGSGGPAEVPQAFRRYASARWQRNAQVQARARRNGEIFHATGPVRMGRDLAMRVLGAGLLDQPWLYAG
ncbi:MAG: FAD-dependent monooxygenase [Variovorax sp.]